MILRLFIAFTRWVWGVSPAFVKADSGAWYMVMFFGAAVDIAVVAIPTFALIDWIKGRIKYRRSNPFP